MTMTMTMTKVYSVIEGHWPTIHNYHLQTNIQVISNVNDSVNKFYHKIRVDEKALIKNFDTICIDCSVCNFIMLLKCCKLYFASNVEGSTDFFIPHKLGIS